MQLTHLKALTKESFIYGLSGIINRLITVFLVPVYTSIFLPEDYGIISFISTTYMLVSLVAICALDSAAARWFYDSEDQLQRKKIFSSWFWFQFGLCLVLALLLLFSYPLFFEWILKDKEYDLYTTWLLVSGTLLTTILPGIVWNWYRLHRKAKATLVFNLSQSITTIALTLIFVIVLKWHILGVFAALFVSGIIFSIVALIPIYQWMYIKYFDWRLLRQMLKFSLPMIPASVAYWLINSTAIYFIMFLLSEETATSEAGLFTVGATIASAVSLFTGAFQQAWGPFAFSIIKEQDAKSTYAQVFLVFGILSSVIILGMFLFSPEIMMIFTHPNYYKSAWVASILSISIILIAFTYIGSIGTSIVKNSVYYSQAVLIGSAITLLINLALIPLLEKEGAAVATVIGQVIVNIYLYYKANKVYPIPYRFSKVSLYLGSAIIIGTVARFLSFPSVIWGIVVKMVIFIGFGIAIMLSIRTVTKLVLTKLKITGLTV